MTMYTTGFSTVLAKIAGQKLARIAATPEVQDKVDVHFSSADPKKWAEFRKSLRNKSFVAAVRRDERADPKLRRFTDLVGRHVSSKDPGTPVPGGEGKKYRVKFHEDIDRYSCSCPHWTYRLAPSSAGGDCRHIEQVRGSMKKQAGVRVVLPKAVKRLLSAGYVDHQTENRRDETIKAKLTQKAYREIVPSELRPHF